MSEATVALLILIAKHGPKFVADVIQASKDNSLDGLLAILNKVKTYEELIAPLPQPEPTSPTPSNA